MDFAKNAAKPLNLASRLIELVIQLPENDQHSLLRELEEKHNDLTSRSASRPFIKSSEYCTDDYVYWDLFKPS